MADKFTREKHLVGLLMQHLNISVTDYHDPNAAPHQETGVDVVAVIAGARIGIQVTELDTGTVPGKARGEEKKLAREAEKASGGVYFTWGQNDPVRVVASIQRSISRKSTITTAAAFDEVWLLVSTGVPELGSVASTFVMTPWLDVAALDNATLDQLSRSKYHRAFIHSVVGVERALYEWVQHGAWQKMIQEEPQAAHEPSFFDIIQDPEWLADPEGMAEREVKKVLQEIREGKL